MSLFSRTVKPAGDEEKIAIHFLQSIISEISNGRLTVTDAINLMSLNESESDDLIIFLTALGEAEDKLLLSSRIFNYLCLGEFNITSPRDYTSEELFWEMVEAS